MTIGISNNSAALAILRQSSAQDISGQQQTATDRIIDIVSGKTDGSAATGTISRIAAKAQSLADADKRETGGGGGTVSSEMSKSYTGAMSQAVQSSMNNMLVKGSEFERELWKATLENGNAVANALINSVNRYNNPPEQRSIPTNEEWNASIPEAVEKNLAMGIDEKYMEERALYMASDEGYNRHVSTINRINKSNERIETNVLIEGFNMLGGQFGFRFGVTPQLSFDDAGQAHVGAFEVKYGSGQTMLSYDGEIFTAYNEDGSVY